VRRAAALALVVLGARLAAADVTVAGVTFPATVTEAGRVLGLNGAGVRTRAFFFKVYAIALYLPHPARTAAAVEAAGPWRVDLRLLRALSGAEIGNAIADAFARNSGARLPQLRARLDRLTGLFPEVDAGDAIVLAHDPGHGTRVAHGDRTLGTIEGDDFAAALLAVWLGPRPVDADLAQALLAPPS
jgi:hypothetical protein